MEHPAHDAGGFYSALDADSDGVEGEILRVDGSENLRGLTEEEFMIMVKCMPWMGRVRWAEYESDASANVHRIMTSTAPDADKLATGTSTPSWAG